MSNLKIHAGDFPQCKADLVIKKDRIFISLPMFSTGKTHEFKKEEISEISVASEENVKRVGGTVGWGVAGLALLGPVGLLAGLFLGGKGKDVTFIMMFTNGKKLLGTTDAKTYTKLQALVF